MLLRWHPHPCAVHLGFNGTQLVVGRMPVCGPLPWVLLLLAPPVHQWSDRFGLRLAIAAAHPKICSQFCGEAWLRCKVESDDDVCCLEKCNIHVFTDCLIHDSLLRTPCAAHSVRNFVLTAG